jgi:heme a synthase
VFTEHFFKKACWLTIFCTIMLFGFGGLVRVTEAGMGCPDWPKCYGSWIPPTTEAELPANYKEQFRDKRVIKVKRMVAVLKGIGMTNKAKEIEQNKDILIAHDFSFRTMVTEYTNRVFGALTGLFALLTLVSAFQFFKSNTSRFLLVLAGMVFIGFNGWLGSIVVETNLLTGIVTSHFILAFLALAFFMIAYNHKKRYETVSKLSISKVRWVSMVLFTGLMLQIIGGTSIREMVDTMVQQNIGINSDILIAASSEYTSFFVHKTFPFALLALIIGILVYIKRSDRQFDVRLLITLLVLFVLQGVSGSLNLITGNSTISQFMHVALGGLVFAAGLQWIIKLFRTRVTTA